MPTVTVEKTDEYLVLKIPLKAVEDGQAELSHKWQNIVDSAITEGLVDLDAGRVFGPFKNVKEFKNA